MKTTDLDVVVCPRCGGKLGVARAVRMLRGDLGDGELGCKKCKARYPVLGGVPILVDDPAGYCAAHRDVILASLAEQGLAERDTTLILRGYADAVAHPVQIPANEDWTAHEEDEKAAPVFGTGPDAERVEALFRAGDAAHPRTQLSSWVEATRTTHALELGPGVVPVLRGRRVETTFVDLSLRALLHAKRKSPFATTVVADVVNLPFRDRAFDLVVAAHVIDLAEPPSALADEVARLSKPKGSFLVTTSEPALGTGDDGALEQLLVASGFVVRERRDGLLWPRLHSARFVELYSVQAIRAERKGR